MGLFDSVIGAIAANSGGAAGGSGGADALQAVMGLLNQSGGLPALLQKLQQAGLGDAVNSWVSTGANQPVSAASLGEALGGNAVAGFARQLGLDPQQGLGVLAQLLPQVVDGLSPQGQLPAGGADLGSLLGGLLGGAGGSASGAAGAGDLAGMLGGLLGKR